MYRIIYVAGAILLTACTSQQSNDTQSLDNNSSSTVHRTDDPATPTPAQKKKVAAKEAAVGPVSTNQGNGHLASAEDPTTPSSMPRECYLKVDGVVHVNGTCPVFPMGKDEYTLNTWTKGKPKNSHFAMVSANPDGTGTATWNADPDDDRALDPLGTVRKDGDCWVNDRARLCVR